jgi:hypothetical protein
MAVATVGPAVRNLSICALTAARRAGASLSSDVFNPDWAWPRPEPRVEAAGVPIQGTSRFANVRAAMGLARATQMNDRACSILVHDS